MQSSEGSSRPFINRGLVGNRVFRALWISYALSQLGSLLGALTLTALIYLGASAAQMGLLVAATSAPALLVGVPGGVWIDRLPYRVVLVLSDLGRCVLLLSVPIAAFLDCLGMLQIYLVAFTVGSLEVLFSLAYRSVLPAVVPQADLVDANASIRAGEAVAETVAPTVGGVIVQAASGPIAVMVDALSFLASGLFLLRVKVDRPVQRSERTQMFREAVDGLRAVTDNRTQRAILGMSATYGFFASFLLTLFALRVLREIGLSPVHLGLLAAGGGLGSIVGALLVAPMSKRLGIGPCIIVAYVLAVAFGMSIPLAAGPAWAALTLLFCGQLLGNMFYVVENVASLSLRQAITSQSQMGRANAAFLTVNSSLRPLGALVAGFLGERIGVQETLFIGAFGIIAASLWLVFSPLFSIRELPAVRAGS